MSNDLTTSDNGVQLVYNIGGLLYAPGVPTKDNKSPNPVAKGRWEFGYRPGDKVMTISVNVDSGMELGTPCNSIKLSAPISPDGIVEVNRWLCTVSSQIAAIPSK